MNYPTLEEVATASQIQLARWYRFLPSPGMSAVNANCTGKEFYEVMEKEGKILDLICERFAAMGGFTPEISKVIGW